MWIKMKNASQTHKDLAETHTHTEKQIGQITNSVWINMVKINKNAWPKYTQNK